MKKLSKRRLAMAFAAALAAVALVYALARNPHRLPGAGQAKIAVKDTSLGLISKFRVSGPVFNLKAMAAAYICRDGDKQYVTLHRLNDGVPEVIEGPRYDSVEGGWVRVASDVLDTAPKVRAVFSTSVELSRDGKHIAYVARQGTDRFVIIDEKKYGPYAWAELPQDFMRGGRVVYAASRSDGAFVVVDGIEYPTEAPVNGIYIHVSDAGQIAYVVGGADGEHVVADGVAGTKYRAVLLASLRWLRDGRLFYVTKAVDGRHVVHLGQESMSCERVVCSSDDGSGDVVYAMLSAGRWLLMRNGVEVSKAASDALSEYGNIYFPTVAASTGRWAFASGDNATGGFAVVDGTAQGRYAAVGGLTWSPDGRRCVYSAVQLPSRLGDLVRRIRYYVGLGGSPGTGIVEMLIVDGVEKVYPNIWGIFFSPDSAHVAVLATDDDYRLIVVLDNAETTVLANVRYVLATTLTPTSCTLLLDRNGALVVEEKTIVPK